MKAQDIQDSQRTPFLKNAVGYVTSAATQNLAGINPLGVIKTCVSSSFECANRIYEATLSLWAQPSSGLCSTFSGSVQGLKFHQGTKAISACACAARKKAVESLSQANKAVGEAHGWTKTNQAATGWGYPKLEEHWKEVISSAKNAERGVEEITKSLKSVCKTSPASSAESVSPSSGVRAFAHTMIMAAAWSYTSAAINRVSAKTLTNNASREVFSFVAGGAGVCCITQI